jgi:hypothetical protein
MAARNEDESSCPRCGGSVWNPLLDARRAIAFSLEPVACAKCGLTGSRVGVSLSVAPDRIQTPQGLVTIDPEELHVELVDQVEWRGGLRLVHVPTGITLDTRAHDAYADNYRAALQSLALQLLDRRRGSDS